MDFGSQRVYNFELWSVQPINQFPNPGTMLADISAICQNREYILTRNDAEQLTFDIDLTTFENYCASINVDPATLITPYVTDVKVKRNGQYLFVVQVVGVEFNCQPNDSGVNTETGNYNQVTSLTETITVTCTGYLNLYSDRYWTGTFTDIDPALLASDLVSVSQSINGVLGNVGIFQPEFSSYLTGASISPILTQQQVKEELQTLAELPGSPFDFYIDSNKTFFIVESLGNQRSDLTLTYGGPGSNVTGLYHQRTAAGTLFNEIIGQGNGTGSIQLTTTQDNTASQLDFMLRQTIIQYSNVSDQPTLDAYAAADLGRLSTLLEVPQIITTGKIFDNGIPFLGVGDRVPLAFPTHPYLANMDRQYFRIEVMDVKLDDNDFEYEITLTMDNYGLNISI